MCLGKSIIDFKKNSVNVNMNPVICIVFASFLCNVLLNILIYKKRRKNEKEDKGKKSNRIFTNRVSQSLGSFMVNLFHLSIAVTVSTNNTILKG